MKKATTYIFAAAALLNLWYAACLCELAERMEALYVQIIGRNDPTLPWLTDHVLACPWWPYVFAVVCAGGAILSVCTKSKDLALTRCLVALLALETFFLFATAFAYCFPQLPMTPFGLN